MLLAGLGAYLLWPAPTLDAGRLDAALPTQHDLHGFVPYDGLTGSLKVPPANKKGRAVLSGHRLAAQCRKWRADGDGWACRQVHGVGMVVLERSQNVFFRVLSNVLAYDGEGAAEDGWDGLVADIRRKTADNEDIHERPAELGDESRAFKGAGVTVLAIRTGTVVVEATVWDGDGTVTRADQDAMVEKWPALQLSKIGEQL